MTNYRGYHPTVKQMDYICGLLSKREVPAEVEYRAMNLRNWKDTGDIIDTLKSLPLKKVCVEFV